MNIVIIGPGAMGCLFAGLLSEAGHEVWLLDKRNARATAIGASGVRIDDDSGTRRAAVRATADPGDIARADVLCVFVKAYDTGDAIAGAAPLAGPDTTVVTLQNGLGNVERIAELVDRSAMVCGSTAHGSTVIEPGHVRHAGAGPTALAAVAPGNRARADRVAALLGGAGIHAAVTDDPEALTWSKLVINAAINPLTALSRLPNGSLLEDDGLRDQALQAAAETAKVARAKGIGLMFEDEGAEVARVCRATAGNISSMLQDVRHGRRTEIDYITGAIVEEARTLGIKVPVNEMLLEEVHALERQRGVTS